MNVIPVTLKSGSVLSEDYIHRFDQVKEIYGEDFRQTETWVKRAAWLRESEHTRVNRAALVDCLRQYNEKHNSHEEVHKSLDLLLNTDTLVITGGQQGGLLTGSLLVIYKAATIIQTARQASQQLQQPVVPVFWIAGEDHDWEEVNHTYIPTMDQSIVKLKVDGDSQELRNSVSYTEVTDEQWNELYEQLSELLPDSTHKPELLQKINKAISKAGNLTESFAKLMGELFGEYGLVLLDSADPKLRKLEAPVFKSLIRNNDQLEHAYLAAAKRIENSGYALQAEVNEGAANLFYIHEGRRLLLTKQEGVYQDRRGIVKWEKHELLNVVEEYPDRFSNNVLTRPLMQDTLFPVLATVLGQGEISYWAITRDAFEVMGLRMPILLPRMSFTVVEPGVTKVMEKYKVTYEDAQLRLDELRSSWLEEQQDWDISGLFAETRQRFEELYQPLLTKLGDIEAGLHRIGDTNKEKILQQMSYMENKALESLERKHASQLRQWDLIGHSLFPMGKPQERVYNSFYFINQYGMAWLKDLMEVSRAYIPEHLLIQL